MATNQMIEDLLEDIAGKGSADRKRNPRYTDVLEVSYEWDEAFEYLQPRLMEIAEAAKKEERKRILTLLSEEAKFELFKTEAIIAQQEALLSNNKKEDDQPK